MSEKKEREKRIPAVDPNARKLNYTSVSAISKFDPGQYGGCNTKWYLRYVMGIKEEQQAHQVLGVNTHSQLQHYLGTGEDVLGDIARAGKHLLPTPGADLLIEWGFDNRGDSSRILNFEGSLVNAADVPLVGFMDFVHRRGEYVNEGAELLQDPEGAVEVGDHKTTSNVEYALKEPSTKLIQTTQMSGYGEFVRQLFPDAPFVRLSHVYYQTRGAKRAVKKTMLAPIATVDQQWHKNGHDVVQRMKDIAKRENVDEVPKNLEACTAWKGCDYQRNCFKSPIGRVKMSFLSKFQAINGTAAPQTPVASAPPASVVAALPPPPPSVEVPKKASRLKIEDVSTTPDLLPARNTLQGKFYEVNGVPSVFLCMTNGQFSFLPTAGGTPQLLGPDALVKPMLAPASEAPVPASTPQAAPPPPPPPVVAAPPPAPVEAKQPEVTAPLALEPKKRGRKPKEQTQERVTPAGGIRLFINCVPNEPHAFLDQYIHGLAEELREGAGVGDIRCVLDKSSALAYGGWRGALAEAVRTAPPEDGAYVVFTRGSEFADVVVEALAPLVADGYPVRAM